MEKASEPFVSVVTPVYNGETFLAECIESILGQTYKNWEYVIVNNYSTDRTPAIAQRYAEKDARIRIHHNSTFLPLMQNLNNAMRQISPESKYCKVVHADDFLLPDCITQMVRLAEAHPSVGVVGSYRINGDQMAGGVRHPIAVISGREIGRSTLLGGPDVFGPPTAILLRSELVRSRPSFYNEINYSTADKEAVYDILRTHDFGFVHQVLTCFRVHKEQASTFLATSGAYQLGKIIILEKYGQSYLGRDEHERLLNETWQSYYQLLANGVFELREKKFWSFTMNMRKAAGHPLSIPKLIVAILSKLFDALLNPKNSLERILRRL
ncbi:glycosyltransferase family 2 protein [Candidatus Manganitrophus noduliformans]|uniref:Glycosyltransferase family 2 protein n=1 Tax=Candidatus Manganitrophus noduliformans TaxID=2606439 RepID=A0A7X6DRM3_9BACT|nr:glycosyltransferase family A protein [Candidatus Manganitrophus noduliformans]NKE72118.1 glycosyltransferase family 2 protein [Candidatus Manganitrophus noduliformans]